jgi:RNA polymerase sigma-70 factor (ECF subfamily)
VTEFPDTRDSLLVQVKDPNNAEAWEQFARIYRPVIYRLARNRGMQDADAQDLAQRVLIAVASAIGRWERDGETVRFRHWLRRVTRNAIINALTRQPHDRATGGSLLLELPQEQPQSIGETERQIELEYQREIFLQAAEMVRMDVRSDTWQAFEMTVIDGHGIEAAAAELGKSIGAIYLARSRIMRRLRETVNTIENAER